MAIFGKDNEIPGVLRNIGERGAEKYGERGDEEYGERGDEEYGERGAEKYGERDGDKYGGGVETGITALTTIVS